jgi:hypothetical protein
MKYMSTFVIGHCCPFKVAPLRLCNGSNISTTAGSIAESDFLESHIGWSVTVPEFQGYSGKYALIPVISPSKIKETARDHIWKISRVEDHNKVLVFKSNQQMHKLTGNILSPPYIRFGN